MQEKRIRQGAWIRGKLIVIEDVPSGVCVQRGEKVVQADVGRAIAAVVEDSNQLRKARTITVPVIKFAADAA